MSANVSSLLRNFNSIIVFISTRCFLLKRLLGSREVFDNINVLNHMDTWNWSKVPGMVTRMVGFTRELN